MPHNSNRTLLNLLFYGQLWSMAVMSFYFSRKPFNSLANVEIVVHPDRSHVPGTLTNWKHPAWNIFSYLRSHWYRIDHLKWYEEWYTASSSKRNAGRAQKKSHVETSLFRLEESVIAILLQCSCESKSDEVKLNWFWSTVLRRRKAHSLPRLIALLSAHCILQGANAASDIFAKYRFNRTIQGPIRYRTVIRPLLHYSTANPSNLTFR